MFGLGAPELIILVIILVIITVVIKMLNKSSISATSKNSRRCLVCSYQGEMKTWLGNYGLPQFIALIGILFYLIPGLIFIAWGWKKYKCPNCGALSKNIPLELQPFETKSDIATKKCPFCAEDIKTDAIKCRFCGSNI